jgi:hypothetical protein
MKISFRDGIYITLVKTIIFMRVCLPLSRKTMLLTESPVSGSVATDAAGTTCFVPWIGIRSFGSSSPRRQEPSICDLLLVVSVVET